MLSVPAFAGAEKDGEVRKLEHIPANVMESVKEAVETFRTPLEVEPPGQKQILKTLRTSKPGTLEDICHPAVTAYYFFSFSMPEESIRLAIEDALRINHKCEKRIVLILRGFIENSLKATIRKFYSLMKEERPEGDWPVTIDPPLFEKYNVQEVPVVVLDNGEKTGQIKGLRIDAALEKLEDSLSALGKYGTTYPIKEMDIREVIASKAKELERRLKESINDMKTSAYTLSRYEGRFEQAREDRVYYIDPSVVLTEDIRDHQGRILFPKGAFFNPADYLPLGKYVILDGRNKKQVEFALKGEFKKMILCQLYLTER